MSTGIPAPMTTYFIPTHLPHDYMSTYIHVPMTTCLPTCLSSWLHACLHTYPYDCMPAYIPTPMTTCLPTYLPLWLHALYLHTSSHDWLAIPTQLQIFLRTFPHHYMSKVTLSTYLYIATLAHMIWLHVAWLPHCLITPLPVCLHTCVCTSFLVFLRFFLMSRCSPVSLLNPCPPVYT